jgi:hypothetical protein
MTVSKYKPIAKDTLCDDLASLMMDVFRSLTMAGGSASSARRIVWKIISVYKTGMMETRKLDIGVRVNWMIQEDGGDYSHGTALPLDVVASCLQDAAVLSSDLFRERGYMQEERKRIAASYWTSMKIVCGEQQLKRNKHFWTTAFWAFVHEESINGVHEALDVVKPKRKSRKERSAENKASHAAERGEFLKTAPRKRKS